MKQLLMLSILFSLSYSQKVEPIFGEEQQDYIDFVEDKIQQYGNDSTKSSTDSISTIVWKKGVDRIDPLQYIVSSTASEKLIEMCKLKNDQSDNISIIECNRNLIAENSIYPETGGLTSLTYTHKDSTLYFILIKFELACGWRVEVESDTLTFHKTKSNRFTRHRMLSPPSTYIVYGKVKIPEYNNIVMMNPTPVVLPIIPFRLND